MVEFYRFEPILNITSNFYRLERRESIPPTADRKGCSLLDRLQYIEYYNNKSAKRKWMLEHLD